MPSPFPGMDPYIEGQIWADFHHEFIGAVRGLLQPALRPRYAAHVEERVSPSLPMPETVREAFLEIRLEETQEVVVVLEVLSPSNKRAHSEGWDEYNRKRNTVLQSAAHLIEIDLLRGGHRMPMREAPPHSDYLALLSRAQRRPFAEVWAVSLRDRLPLIPVPLAGDDADVTLDLQEAFNAAYDRAGYDYMLNYNAPIEPSLPPEEEEWALGVVKPEAS